MSRVLVVVVWLASEEDWDCLPAALALGEQLDVLCLHPYNRNTRGKIEAAVGGWLTKAGSALERVGAEKEDWGLVWVKPGALDRYDLNEGPLHSFHLLHSNGNNRGYFGGIDSRIHN